jgi:hypothetical protein
MLDKLKSLMRTLGFSSDPPLETFQQLVDFIDSRSAYVAQVTLYTYVKARSGTQHPKLFENEAFLTSLRIARWHIFGAAVADVTLFAAAQMVKVGALTGDQAGRFATAIMHEILHEYPQDDIPSQAFAGMNARGRQRAETADWTFIATGPAAFQASADAVFRWAPIADELKNDDEDIVRNSIHLRWIGVRRDIKQLIRPALIADDWH